MTEEDLKEKGRWRLMSNTYISGRISGLTPDEYESKFYGAAEQLQKEGLNTLNPLDLHDPRVTKSWSEYMRKDLIEMLACCDSVHVLSGWKESKGAALEVTIARALDMPIIDYDTRRALTAEELPSFGFLDQYKK